MAGITTAMCSSYKKELLEALHDHNNAAGSTFKLGLFRTNVSLAGTYSAATTNYSDVTGNSDEHGTPTGYSTGGKSLTNTDPAVTSTTAFTTWDNQTWGSSTIVSPGAFIYNSTAGNRMVSVHWFGDNKSSSVGDFVVQFPVGDASTAIIRIA